MAYSDAIIVLLIIVFFEFAQGASINETRDEITLSGETIPNQSSNSSDITTIIVLPGQSIQAAIQTSMPGNIIEVQNGIYHENIHITKRLFIRGIVDAGGEQPILDADGENSAIKIMADGVRIENITVVNTSLSHSGEKGMGIKVVSNNCVIKGVSAHNNRYGIYLIDSKNCTLINNNLSDNYNGIILSSADNNSLLGNNIGGKRDYGDSGINLESSNNNTLANNSLSNNNHGIILVSSANNFLLENNARGTSSYDGSGIELDLSNNNILFNNSLIDCYSGITLTSSENNSLLDNNARETKDISDSGIRLDISENNILVNNSLIDNSKGITLSLSDNNYLSDNNARGMKSDYGVLLSHSNNNIFSSNNLSQNKNGLGLVWSDGNVILNNYAKGIGIGIALGLDHSNNTSIHNNNLSFHEYGISLVSSSYNRLTNNSISKNRYNFQMEGSDLSHFDNYIDVTNRVNNRSIYYLRDVSNVTIDSTYDVGQVGCFNCTNIKISGLNLSDNGYGVILVGTNNSSVSENILSDLRKGIQLYLSRHNTLVNNNISNNYYGIKLDISAGNILSANNLSFNTYGCNLDDSHHNLLLNNYAASNERKGFSLDSSHNNSLLGNYASGSQYGIGVESSKNNNIDQNNLINNKEYGIALASSSGNRLSNNYMFGNMRNFQMGKGRLSDFDNDIDVTNLVNGRPIIYLKDANNKTINLTSNAGMVGCFNCTNIKVIGLNISNVGMGISFIKTNFSEVWFNNISDTNYGIFLYLSNNNSVKSDDIYNSSFGIYMELSDNNLIEDNSASINITEVPIGSVDLYNYNNKFSNNSENESDIYPEVQYEFGYSSSKIPGVLRTNDEAMWAAGAFGFDDQGTKSSVVNGANGKSNSPAKNSKGGDSDGMGLQMPKTVVKKPTATEEIGKLIYEQIESLKWGQIVFTPPTKAWKGVPISIKARISQNLSENISQGLEKFPKTERDKIKVSYEMNVQLDGGNNFDISPKVQKPKIIPESGYAEWDWSATPLHEGTHTIKLTATATINLNENIAKEPDIKVYEKDITVEVDWFREAKKTILGGINWIVLSFIGVLGLGLINWLSGGILNRIKSMVKKEEKLPDESEKTEVKD